MLTGYYAGMMADRGGEAKRRAELARAQKRVMDNLYASYLKLPRGNFAVAESKEPTVSVVRLTV